jgi:integrase
MASIRKKKLKNGAISYEVRIHRATRGKDSERSRSFPSLTDAKRWAAAAEAKLNAGGVIPPRNALAAQLADVIASYADAHKLNPPEDAEGKEKEKANPKAKKKREQELMRLSSLSHDRGEWSVASLTNEEIKQFLADLLKTPVPGPKKSKDHPLYKRTTERTYSPSTVRKQFFQLKKVLLWYSIKNNFELPPNVFKVEIPSGWAGQRERRLEEGEEQRLLDAITGHKDNTKGEATRIIGLALETAMRSQEILLCRWTDITLPGRTLNIPAENSKTKTKRQVPLSKKAVAILEEQRKHCPAAEPLVFPHFLDSMALAHEFKKWCFRAKIKDLHFHDLRHEAISRLFEKTRLDLMEIMKMSGHAVYSTIERYTHLRPSAMADKLD